MRQGDSPKNAAVNRPPIEVNEAEWQLIQLILSQHVPHCAVWAFGSRAKGHAKKHSDLDLAILSDQPLGLECMAQLSEAFAQSDLPYKVDLVNWATLTDTFKKIIEQDRVLLRTASLSQGK